MKKQTPTTYEVAEAVVKRSQELRKKLIVITLAGVALISTGCMQLTGANSIDLWGAKFEANTGFEVSAGVQQFDHVLDRKGMNVEKMDNRKLEKY